MPTFQYDTDGNRTLTVQPDGTILYTPFPDYELTDPPTGADTVRTTYRLGGQIVAVQTKVGAAAGAFYFTYTDHLGNISAMSTAAGTFVADSKARYDPFGRINDGRSSGEQPVHLQPRLHWPPPQQHGDEQPGPHLYERAVLYAGDWAVYQPGYDCA